MNEPRLTVGPANHFSFALKPHYLAITCMDSINRFQRIAGQNQLGRVDAPAGLIFRMNLPIPANGIAQPFALCETEQSFNLWTDVSFAEAPVQIGHEDNRRYLLDESSIFPLSSRDIRLTRVFGSTSGKEDRGQRCEYGAGF